MPSPSADDLKGYIQEGFRRASEQLDSKVITAEAGEFEQLQFPAGFITELVSARYGTLDTPFEDWTDVTHCTCRDLLQGNALPITNERMGVDPKAGCRKVLRIQYKHSSHTMEVVVQEGQGLELPPGSAEGLLCALYGVPDKMADVIAPLRQLLLSGQNVTVSNEEFGVDPAPGQLKQLRLQYKLEPRISFRLRTGGELAAFEALAAPLFASLRKTFSVGCADFFHSMVSGNLLGGKTEASGKSGEIFWRTADQRYVLKTVSEQEVGQLIKMLPEYQEHLESSRLSVLTRYFGAYRFNLEGENTFFVVMSNVLEGVSSIESLFDLKGTTEDRWVDPATGGCLKDNNFAPITLFLEKADAKAINDALAADTAFLQDQGIMDYSLLLALCPPDVPTPQTTGAHRRVFEAKESQSLGEARDCKLCLGLVDILVTYGWKKKVAHLLKSLTIGWVDAIDTMPPDIYAERFCNYLAKKLRPITALLQFTEVPKDIFKMPCSPMGRSGGTASFFAMELLQEEEDVGEQGASSKHYWIGKDLARARDEVIFYEVAKTLQGKEGWQILNFMTPYKGVCRVPYAQKDGKPAQDVDLMLLRNCRDGFVTARMLDIKMGNVTAVGGWQGKGSVKAFMQNITVDHNTNSAGEGFRLEGFDNPPALLRSIEHLQLNHIPRHAQKRLRRFNLQRMQANEFLRIFLDLHRVPEHLGRENSEDTDGHDEPSTASQGSRRRSTRETIQKLLCYGSTPAAPVPHPAYPAHSAHPSTQAPPASQLRAIEVQELVLLQCIQQVAGLVAACRKVPVPQQWIGSSVMFVFDCASLPQRSAVQTMLTIPEIPVPARVHIFDWGRSELNTEDSHALLSQAEQADRQKFWRLYRVALAKLLYNCCSLYVARFWKPVASITFRIWDKDAFTDDDFIGAAVLSAEDAVGMKDLKLQDLSGSRVKAGFLFKGETSLKVSCRPLDLPTTSRLRGGMEVCLHEAKNIPKCDVASASDPFVEVSALGISANVVRKHLGQGFMHTILRTPAHCSTVIKDNHSPAWEEEFEIGHLTDAAKAPFMEALATAVGKVADDADLACWFPLQFSIFGDSCAGEDAFVAACVGCE